MIDESVLRENDIRVVLTARYEATTKERLNELEQEFNNLLTNLL